MRVHTGCERQKACPIMRTPFRRAEYEAELQQIESLVVVCCNCGDFLGLRATLSLRERQGKGERRSTAELAGHGDLALHEACERAGNREAESNSI